MKKIPRIAKIVSLCTMATLLVSLMSLSANAETQISISLRIEAPESNIFYKDITVSDTDNKITAADALSFADSSTEDLTITGIDTGYISEINGTKAGKFGGYDGWYYSVNGEIPSVGISDTTLKNGDILVVYYGGFPCQIPFADTSALSTSGIITFKSNDQEYDENWNATNVVNPVADAEVTINARKYTTNANGEITIDKNETPGELSVQISKKDSSNAPAVLRFAPDYTISYSPSIPIDILHSDTDTNSDSDSDSESTTDSDSDTDTNTDSSTDTDKTSSQNTSSTTSSSSNSTTTTTTTTTTVTTPTPTVTPEAVASMMTGDRRTYLALTVFAIAAIVVVVMFLLGKKKNS